MAYAVGWELHRQVRVVTSVETLNIIEKHHAVAAFLDTFLAVEKSIAPQAKQFQIN